MSRNRDHQTKCKKEPLIFIRLNYQECVDFLFQQLPMYQNMGKAAFKKDLTNTIKLLEFLNNPHLGNTKWIHVAGTNGKGSVSSIISSILIESGLKVGLYTSPHLVDFTERIRINGSPINRDSVIDFVQRISPVVKSIKPSFFEITVAMAFDFFHNSKVDIGIIEVGLGGRLDSTNVITPILSVITSIGMDHMDMLGDSIEKIAFEKAGIIKPNVPCLISRDISQEAKNIIHKRAYELNSPIEESTHLSSDLFKNCPLKGIYQRENLSTAINSINLLDFNISQEHIKLGLKNVVQNSGIRGRWEIHRDSPIVILDTGHNIDGVSSNIHQLNSEYPKRSVHVIWGMVNDKDRKSILKLLPKDWNYYAVRPNVPRGLDEELLATEMSINSLNVKPYDNINIAYTDILSKCRSDEIIFIGGSTFLVADFLIEPTK